MSRRGARWEIWADTGGTFTDCVGLDPEGEMHRVKVLSHGAVRGRVLEAAGADGLAVSLPWRAPDDFFLGSTLHRLDGSAGVRVSGFAAADRRLRLDAALEGLAPGEPVEIRCPCEAPVLGAHLLTGTPLGRALPPLAMRLATTRGTNALLERGGAATALFVTRGFGDLLVIGNQQRPDLFALEVERADPLYAAVVEVEERLAADGTVVRPLEVSELEEQVRGLVEAGIETAAVALLNAYRDPAHELRVADCLRAAGFRHVSVSAELARRIRYLPRAETTLVDAYLSPAVGDYLDSVARGVGESQLLTMTSAGGVVRAAAFRPKDSLLSGPAGGVVGAASAGRASGEGRLLAFDMGGTSTDVSRFDGDFDYRYETRVGGARLLTPALAIETVAAGGGSICSFDGTQLKVGPESAGAVPGPACYGLGGPLTLTDVNLLLGRLDPDRFEIPIEPRAARAALEGVVAAVERGGQRLAAEEVLEGLLRIADERMADAVRRISVREGFDPSEFCLVAFGGAGGQHACAVAELLEISRILVPADAGLLSAHGLGAARIERFAERQVLVPLAEAEDDVPGWLEELAAEALARMAEEGVAPERAAVRRRHASLRLTGQDAVLEVEVSDEPLAEAFKRLYRRRYGYLPPERPIEIEGLRVVASEVAGGPSGGRGARASDSGGTPAVRRRCWLDGEWRQAATRGREQLAAGERIQGAALVLEAHSATWVAPGWSCRADDAGALVLAADRAASGSAAVGPRREVMDAVQLELFTNRFRALVREMGEMLRRTALSVNVKERLDFSCALLDPKGELVVNAPHIPVHLGALGLCVREVRAHFEPRPGDVWVTNHPAFGGSHLPDVTVITPVFAAADDGGELLGYTASRAHHAEIGGVLPGSMPPTARSLAEEGVVLAPRLLLSQGTALWQEIEELLRGGPHPSRAVAENLADLSAAVAANYRGAEALRTLASRHGVETISAAMASLADAAEARVRRALERLPQGVLSAEERLDDGSPIAVRLEVESGSAVVDFGGTAGVHPGNLNATPAVVRSAVLYVLRLLIDEPLPLNEGLMRAVELVLPKGLLDPQFPEDPERAPAVVGGNVETSQRVVDTLLKALGLAACSQGTMNNVVFGNERYGYYETVCGGCGAGPGFAGASAVHSHMTNTAITDAEVLEHRYPVRLESFRRRLGSGGAGRFPGGDGVVRELLFLEEAELSLLSQHRVEAPYGVDGGGPGRRGSQRIVAADGSERELQGIDTCTVAAGERLVLETPGGGGWGAVGGEEKRS